MTKNELFKGIEKILNLPSGSINEDSKNEDFYEWDSLGSVVLMSGLEEEFGKAIPDDIIFFSVKDIIEFYGI